MSENSVKDFLPSYSFLIAYRDRSLELVKRCLQSICEQTFQGFELILVDYGSHPESSVKVKELCREDKRFFYVHSQTEGYFWSRSSALNLSASLAGSERLIVVDIDLILPKDFLEIIDKRFDPSKVLMYQTYYLPRKFKAYESLFSQIDKITGNLSVSDSDSNGLIACSRQAFEAVEGYDEYFRLWGWEDIDLMQRLEVFLGKQRAFIKVDELPTFHQWHPFTHSSLPKGWQKLGKEYLELKKKRVKLSNYLKKFCPPSQKILKVDDRPALKIYRAGDLVLDQEFRFSYPKLSSFSEFYNRFNHVKTGEYLWVQYRFEPFRPSSGSRLAGWMIYLNHWLKKFGISYRMVDLMTYDTEVMSVDEVRDFLFYFVLHHEQTQIRDYYLEIREEELIFIVVKQ